jgi:hypothetical protein
MARRQGSLTCDDLLFMQAVIFATSGMTSEQSRIASGVQAWRTASLTSAAAPSRRAKSTAVSKITVQAK